MNGNRYDSARDLRREAVPLAYSDLDQGQKAGFRRVVQMLDQAAGALPDKPKDPRQSASPWNPWIPERDRRSNVLFLSGERGTGKTTLMLSVLDQFLYSERRAAAHFPDADDLKIQLDRLANRILWLAPIDLEPLPQPSNLYAAILARVEQALDHQRNRSASSMGAACGEDPLAFPGILDPREDDCNKRLRLLQRNVATAWGGNLDKRAGSLDREEYFHEVVRAERARVKLPGDLDELLDHLAWHGPWCGGLKNPLFVLPIDDIDLNPAHAVELLKLLRTLANRRLFTLVLGDLAQMESVAQYRIAGSLGELLGPVRGQDSDLIKQARTAAGDGLRKLIPPGQRIRLGVLSVEEALEFRLPTSPTDSSKPAVTLQKLMEDASVCLHPVKAIIERNVRPAEAGFDDLNMPLFRLIADSVTVADTDSEIGRKACLNSRFLGLRILSAAQRFLTDLALEFQSIVAQLPTDGQAKDKQAGVNWLKASHARTVEMVAHRFQETAPTAQVRDSAYEHEPGRWCLNREDFTWKMTHAESRAVHLDGFRLEIPKLYEAQVRAKAGDGTGSEVKLGPDCASSLSLLHDLLALQLTPDEETLSSVIGSTLFPGAEKTWATVTWDAGMQVNWRLPEWLTIGEYSLFVDYWMAAHARVADADPERLQEYFLFAWIAGATNVLAIPLFDRKRSGLIGLPGFGNGDDLPWFQVVSLLEKVFGAADKQKNNWALSEFVRIVGDWAADLAMILSPEAGAPKSVADRFFGPEQGGLHQVWLTGPCRERVRRRRAEQCQKLNCVPSLLGLISPAGAWYAIRHWAAAVPGVAELLQLAKEEWDQITTTREESPPCTALDALAAKLNEEAVAAGGPVRAQGKLANVSPPPLSPDPLRHAAECADGLLRAARHNPRYHDPALQLSPSAEDLRRYANWTPDHT
jgi:hypothetical protein